MIIKEYYKPILTIGLYLILILLLLFAIVEFIDISYYRVILQPNNLDDIKFFIFIEVTLLITIILLIWFGYLNYLHFSFIDKSLSFIWKRSKISHESISELISERNVMKRKNNNIIEIHNQTSITIRHFIIIIFSYIFLIILFNVSFDFVGNGFVYLNLLIGLPLLFIILIIGYDVTHLAKNISITNENIKVITIFNNEKFYNFNEIKYIIISDKYLWIPRNYKTSIINQFQLITINPDDYSDKEIIVDILMLPRMKRYYYEKDGYHIISRYHWEEIKSDLPIWLE